MVELSGFNAASRNWHKYWKTSNKGKEVKNISEQFFLFPKINESTHFLNNLPPRINLLMILQPYVTLSQTDFLGFK